MSIREGAPARERSETPDPHPAVAAAEHSRVRDLRVLLQTVVSGGTLAEALARVVEWIERVIPETRGSVLLLDDEGVHLQHAAAPSLDPAYCALIDGLPIGPQVGSCGTAAYTGEAVVVADLRVDPLWENYRDLAAPFGMRACWSHPIRGSTGRVLGTFALYRDRPSLPTDAEWEMLVDASHLTALLIERSRADEVRRQSENDLRSILEHAPDIIARLDARGRYRYVNPAMLALVGVPAVRLVGRTSEEIEWMAPLRERLSTMMAMAARDRTPQRDEFAVETPIGERWLDASVVPEQNDAGVLTGFVFIARDRSERRMADLALRRSEARLQRVFNLSGRSLALLDTSGRLQKVGDLAVSNTGIQRDRMIGEHFWEIPAFASLPQSQDALRRAITAAAAGTAGGGEVQFRGRNGDLRVGWFNVFPVHDAQGRVVEIVMEGSDMTDTRLLEQRLRQSEKMESLGRLAGGIAHDFNNILAAVLGYGELLLGEALPGSEAHEGLQHIVHSSQRARDLVRQILAFSRKADVEHVPLDLRALVVDGIRLLRASIPSTIELRERVSSAPMVVSGDASQLSQILLNLGSNAEYVLRGESEAYLDVELTRVMLEGARARSLELPKGEYALLTVRDSGRGIPADVVDKIFEPFFTTKPVGEGTGMGLAVVHGIVVAHGGNVRVESSPSGTAFEILIPIVSEEARVATRRAGGRSIGSGRVLVIDDERAIVSFLERILPRRGFEVECHTSPLDALKQFRARPYDFDLVITDRTMPRLSGDDLAEEVHALRPGLPVIIISGRGSQPGDEDTHGDTVFRLAKPFDVVDLMHTIEVAQRAARGRLDDGSL